MGVRKDSGSEASVACISAKPITRTSFAANARATFVMRTATTVNYLTTTQIT